MTSNDSSAKPGDRCVGDHAQAAVLRCWLSCSIVAADIGFDNGISGGCRWRLPCDSFHTHFSRAARATSGAVCRNFQYAGVRQNTRHAGGCPDSVTLAIGSLKTFAIP